MKKLYPMMVISACSIFFSAANAAPLFQAGDIEAGEQHPISKTSGVASYYANGKSGRVEFTCELQGEKDSDGIEVANAYLKPGKNFDNDYNSRLISLSAGISPLITWTLTDENERNGNIKVFYVAGKNVTIQCKGKKLDR